MKKKSDDLETQPLEDFFAEVERKHTAPWPARLWYFRSYWLSLPWRTVKEAYYSLVAFYQRGRRGWADCDTWRFSIYLSEVVAGMLASSSDHLYSIPAGFELVGDGWEESQEAFDLRYAHWVAFQRDLAQAFADYVAFMESDESREDIGNVRYRELLARMQPLLGKWFAALGD